jgi:hypothetical protein
VRLPVINTCETGFPGIATTQLIQFEMDPGAAVKDFEVASTDVLWVTRGPFTAVVSERRARCLRTVSDRGDGYGLPRVAEQEPRRNGCARLAPSGPDESVSPR